MQRLRLGAIIVEHYDGFPCAVKQIGGREAHPAIVEAVLASEAIEDLCRQDLEDNPPEIEFDFDEIEA